LKGEVIEMATYVATDLHGMYDLWDKIKNYLKEDDTLYYLGDAIDRGKRGFEIFMELLDDPRVIYIKGNHEDTMYNAFTAIGLTSTEWFKAWHKNGGQETLNNIKQLGLSYERKMHYVEQIYDMPTALTYVNDNKTCFYLTHAGITPNEKYFSMNDFDREYYDMWNRKHFLDTWPERYKDKNVVIIHGHTPIQLLYQIAPETFKREEASFPLYYCDKHKINLDIGAFSSNMAILFNLDTEQTEMIIKGE
jgi:serine/threonine protein phosphatase 1